MHIPFLFCLGLCLLVQLPTIKCTSPTAFNKSESVKNETPMKKWEKLENQISDVVGSIFDKITPMMGTQVENLNVSRQCLRQSLQLLKGVRQLKPWALKFLDSSGKLIDGMLEGSLTSFGSYDECVDIKVPSNKIGGSPLFQGQYCSVETTVSLPSSKEEQAELKLFLKKFIEGDPMLSSIGQYIELFDTAPKGVFPQPRLGVCMPSGCSIGDLRAVVQLIGKSIGVGLQAAKCEVKKGLEISSTQIAIITVLSAIVALVLVVTVMDLCFRLKKYENKSTLLNIILAFSLISSVQNLFDAGKSQNALKCLNGIRFISMCWIICAHTFSHYNIRSLASPLRLLKTTETLPFQIIGHAALSVDTFFFMGAFLVSYIFLKLMEDGNYRFNYFLYIVIRLFRFWPSYILYLMFVVVAPLMMSGPTIDEEYFHYQLLFTEKCHKKWWKSLLFIYIYDKECSSHTWYMDVDFHFYVLAPIILIPFRRWPKLGVFLSAIGILTGITSSAIEGYYNSLPPSLAYIAASFDKLDQRRKFITFPLPHASAYCIGLLIGYLFALKPHMVIPRKIQVIGWTSATFSAISLLYGPVNWNRGFIPPLAVRMLHHCFSLTLWSLIVAWCVFNCITGHAGFVNRFLSWSAFAPLGRLTFMAYLSHPVIMTMYMSNLRTPFMATPLSFVWLFFAYLVTTYMVAFGCSMLIEAPFLKIGKIIFEQNREKYAKTPEKAVNSDTEKSRVNNLTLINIKTLGDDYVKNKENDTKTV